MRSEPFFPLCIPIFLAIVALSFFAARLRGGAYLVSCAMFVSVLAAIPIVINIWLYSRGFHPTVQGNAGSDLAMQNWSTWAHMWPKLMYLDTACVGLSFVWLIAYSVWNFRQGAFKEGALAFWYILLTFLLCLFAFLGVACNVPTA